MDLHHRTAPPQDPAGTWRTGSVSAAKRVLTNLHFPTNQSWKPLRRTALFERKSTALRFTLVEKGCYASPTTCCLVTDAERDLHAYRRRGRELRLPSNAIPGFRSGSLPADTRIPPDIASKPKWISIPGFQADPYRTCSHTTPCRHCHCFRGGKTNGDFFPNRCLPTKWPAFAHHTIRLPPKTSPQKAEEGFIEETSDHLSHSRTRCWIWP